MSYFNCKIFSFLILFTLSVFGEDFPNTKKVYDKAGITDQQLTKIDFEVRRLVYSELTQNYESVKAINPSAGNPVITKINNEKFISVFIKSTNPKITQSSIESMGGRIGNIIGDILIADLPVKNLTEIVFKDNIKRVEAAKYQESHMDTSLAFINVDKVHEGINLLKSYKGEDVIVGVVDSGIDWTHPAFNDENGNRVLYLWDTSDDTNPPAEFDYGTEYTKEDLDQQNSNEIDENGHGTHTASTAAGNANGAEYPLDGVAPKADIVFVKLVNLSDTYIVNACDYIFKRAEQLGKPAVINLSIGGLVGGIGNSLFEESLTNLVKPGKLIVASAGNSGSSIVHLQYQMSTDRSNTLWFVPDSSKMTTPIIGYPDSEDFNVGVQVLDSEGNSLFVSPSVGYNEERSGLIIIDQDTLAQLSLSGIPSSIEPYVFKVNLSYEPKSGIKEYVFNLYTYGSAFFNAWINNGFFSDNSDPANNLIAGDNLMTVGTPSTAFNVFSIGAFTTKTEWTDINGNPFSVGGTISDRAYFSSMGPLRDGRIKPDFSAPGHWIAAANSKDANYPDYLILDEKTVHLQGTSMSAPHFTGVVALLLEQNPNLTYDEVFNVLMNTSVSDEITGQVPNNEFGYGRIDAYAAMQQLITSVEENAEIPNQFSLSQNYPNPFNPNTVIKYNIPSINFVSVKVYDVLGNEVSILVNEIKPPGSYNVTFDGSELSSGVYFYRINAGNFQQVKKMIFIK